MSLEVNPDMMKTFLRLLVGEGDTFEIRCLDCKRPKVKPFTAAGWFDDPAKAVVSIQNLDRDLRPGGIYVTLNTVSPDLLSRAEPNAIFPWQESLTTDNDIIRRRWLAIDLDPIRKPGISSTAAEHAKAKQVADAMRDWLKEGFGWRPSAEASSGNGAHLLYRVDMPNDAETTELFRSILKVLAKRFTDGEVKVDELVFNAGRIWKLYGSVARKGFDGAARPHRLAQPWNGVYVAVSPLSLDQLRAVASFSAEDASAQPAQNAASGSNTGTSGISTTGNTSSTLPPLAERVRRATKYLAKMPPGVSGSNGHGVTFRAAVRLVRGFALPEPEALEMLLREYNPRCQPPWSEADLLHKVEDAATKSRKPFGYLLVIGDDEKLHRESGALPSAAPAASSSPPSDDSAPSALPALTWDSFPTDLLPDVIRHFVEAHATAIGCDEAFIAVPLLAALAGVIGNKRTLRLSPTWQVVSVIWTLVVAKSGRMKTPAYRAALKCLSRLQKKALRVFKTDELLYRQKLEEYKSAKKSAAEKRGKLSLPKPQRPSMRHFLTIDVTIERLASILDENPSGVLNTRDEAMGWVKDFDKYRRGQGSDRETWTQTFDAGELKVDRQGDDKKTIYVPRAAVSVTGTVQPKILAQVLTPEAFDSGFAERLLMCSPPKKKKRWKRDSASAGRSTEDLMILFLSLADLKFCKDSDGDDAPVELELEASGAAEAAWESFYDRWADEAEKDEEVDESLREKLESYCARFALVLRVVKTAQGDPCSNVTREDIEEGEKLVRWFWNETRRVRRSLLEIAQKENGMKIIERVASFPGARATLNEINKYFKDHPLTRDDLDALVKRGLGHWEASTGYGPKTEYLVLGKAPGK